MKHTTTVMMLLFLGFAASTYGQTDKRQHYFPVWTFHQDNVTIHGVSLGLWSFEREEPRRTHTNGIKYELIGIGLGMPLVGASSLVSESDSAFMVLKEKTLSERINGLSLSTTGTVCHCLTNGVTVGLVGQINFEVNGISASLVMNVTEKHSGVMATMLSNEAYYMNGLQIGLFNTGVKTRGVQIGATNRAPKVMKGVQLGIFNKTGRLKGVQLGLWNVNQKRKLPIINWNFK